MENNLARLVRAPLDRASTAIAVTSNKPNRIESDLVLCFIFRFFRCDYSRVTACASPVAKPSGGGACWAALFGLEILTQLFQVVADMSFYLGNKFSESP